MHQQYRTDDAEKLFGARCLVLGGGGFIGMNLSNSLAQVGAHVHAYSRRLTFPGTLASGVRWSGAALSDRSTLAAAVQDADFIFHLASSSTPSSANIDPASDALENLISTLHFLDMCQSERSRRIIFVSSGGTVYGEPAEIPIPETAPTDPISAYGIHKLAIEKYLALYHHLHGLDYMVARIANPYGPLQLARKGQGVVAALMQRALTRQHIEIWGTGETVRDFIYIADVVHALLKIAIHRGPSRLFNVGSGRGTTINTLIDEIERIVDVGHLRREYQLPRSVDVPINVLDVQRIGAEIGWTPLVSLDAGLRSTLEWMLQAQAKRLF